MIWLIGDMTNLIGCMLTHQLPFQVIPLASPHCVSAAHPLLDITRFIFLPRRHHPAISVHLLSKNCHSDGIGFYPAALSCWFAGVSAIEREGAVSLPHPLCRCGECSFGCGSARLAKK